jgi:glucose-6-phosphate 1-dehydrogenase
MGVSRAGKEEVYLMSIGDAMFGGGSGKADDSTIPSDALVFFGATGDLAYKKIFPALQNMVRREGLNVPVIAVAKAGWTLEQLRERARASLTEHGGGVDPAVFPRLVALLQYIDGDYEDPSTFSQLRKALGGATRPAHYLAIPPSLFGTVVQALGKSGCAQNARVIVEKPFGHNLQSARQLNKTLHSVFPESAIYRIDHFLGRMRWKTYSSFDLRIHFWNRSGIATISNACRSPWRRTSVSRDVASSTKKPAQYATLCRTIYFR